MEVLYLWNVNNFITRYSIKLQKIWVFIITAMINTNFAQLTRRFKVLTALFLKIQVKRISFSLKMETLLFYARNRSPNDTASYCRRPESLELLSGVTHQTCQCCSCEQSASNCWFIFTNRKIVVTNFVTRSCRPILYLIWTPFIVFQDFCFWRYQPNFSYTNITNPP